MNGRQMAEAARALRPRKVLFIIGYAENAAVGNGHLEPGMQVLTKLFAIDSWPRQNPGFHHQHAKLHFRLAAGLPRTRLQNGRDISSSHPAHA
jgi:hypothetical protein